MLKVSLSTRDSKPGGLIRQNVDFEFCNYSPSTFSEQYNPLAFH
jgi:hypothetical protein